MTLPIEALRARAACHPGSVAAGSGPEYRYKMESSRLSQWKLSSPVDKVRGITWQANDDWGSFRSHPSNRYHIANFALNSAQKCKNPHKAGYCIEWVARSQDIVPWTHRSSFIYPYDRTNAERPRKKVRYGAPVFNATTTGPA